MTPRLSDSLLGAAWTCDLDDEEVFVQDTADEMHELLSELVDVLAYR